MTVKERWLVMSNCQVAGMTHSLSLICPHAKVESCDYWGFQHSADFWRQHIRVYDHIIAIPEFQRLGIVDLEAMPNVLMMPAVYFRAYHPDLQYVFHAGKPVKSPLDDYHSTIVFAAYQHGCSVARTKALFNEKTYDALCYFSQWEREKKDFLDRYAEYDLDFSPELSRWTRAGAFMHSVNHPKAHALHDVALKVAKKVAGDAVVESGIVPHDTLVRLPVFPIFPELAERFGVEHGSYLFKGADYDLLTLDEFIEASFAAYANFGKSELYGNSPHLTRALQMIGGEL